MTTERRDGRRGQPQSVRPFGLARADLLKLRRRRGLFVDVTVLTIVPQVIAYGCSPSSTRQTPIITGRPAGSRTSGNGMSVLIAARRRRGDPRRGERGRGRRRRRACSASSSSPAARASRSSARGSPEAWLRAPVRGVRLRARGDRGEAAPTGIFPRPSVDAAARGGLWVLAGAVVLLRARARRRLRHRSRAYTIGILLAWRMAVGPILAAIGALGHLPRGRAGRRLRPARPFRREGDVNGGAGSTLAGTSVLVLLLWLAIACASAPGGRRRATHEREASARSRHTSSANVYVMAVYTAIT